MESSLFSMKYLSSVHQRTERLVDLIPEHYLEWGPSPQHFTIGDLVRHISSIERFLFIEVIVNGKSKYNGCGKELAPGLEKTISYYKSMHDESKAILESLTENDLVKTCISPSGAVMPIWKWLRAMIEHEIHHRGQLYTYLGMINIKTPPIFGLTSEEVTSLSRGI